MLTKYCRICLTSAGVVHELEEVVHKSLTLYAILCKMYPEAFMNYKDQHWPPRVCGVCKQAVLDAYGLFTVCMATFDVLKLQLQNKPHDWKPSIVDMNFSDQRFMAADSDALDSCTDENIKIKSEENDKSYLISDEEEILDSTEERIKPVEDVNTIYSSSQRNVEEEKDIVPAHIARTIEIQNEVATYNPEIVEISIEMDCVAQNNTISTVAEHVEDFEGSAEYLDDIEDGLLVAEYSDAIINSECLENSSAESEPKEAYAKIFSTKLLGCESCQVVFPDKHLHEKHIKMHSKGFHIFCQICCEGFYSATAMNSHKCKDDSSTLCWICGVLLDTREKHKKHMQDHMQERTWACQSCPMRFSSESGLKGHLRTHKKDKGHCCDVCGARLYSKRNLNYHQRAVHGGGVEKLYSCTICDRRFSLPYMLKTHMNTHTGLRPYSCVYCDRVYGCGGDLVEHVAKHHVGNDNIYQCHLCDADFPKIRELKGHYEVHCTNGEQFYNEILTDFGKFRYTTMDLLKMRHHKEIAQLGKNNALNQVSTKQNKAK